MIDDPAIKPILSEISKIVLVKIAFLLVGVWFLSALSFQLIAGPIYRIELCLKSVLSGELTHKIIIRKKDELHDVISILNETIDFLREKVQNDRNKVEEISSNLSSISEDLDQETAGKIAEINEKLQTVTKDFII